MAQPAPSFNTIRLSFQDSVAAIALNRPRSANRVNRRMVEELAEAVEAIGATDSVRVVTLTGRGSAFSSGWERMRVRSPEELPSYQAARVIARIAIPVVAAINGDAIGPGLEMALAADIRIATDTARLGMPQVTVGALPWDGGTQRLPRVVGRAHALEMLLTGKVLDAAQAHRIGLVSQVVEAGDLADALGRVVDQILSGAPIATRYAKEAVMQGMEAPLEHALRLEADISILLHGTRDRAEGIRSFIQRRKPRFRGR